jgi:uncharacterized protein YeaO (DUF488 family)
MVIKIKRVYEVPDPSDGFRVLVDRLWPRGISKSSAQIDLWLKEIAPSNELRKWYSHDPAKWDEIRKRYFQELDSNPEVVEQIRNYVSRGTVTLVFSSKEEELNNAVTLREYLKSKWVPFKILLDHCAHRITRGRKDHDHYCRSREKMRVMR